MAGRTRGYTTLLLLTDRSVAAERLPAGIGVEGAFRILDAYGRTECKSSENDTGNVRRVCR